MRSSNWRTTRGRAVFRKAGLFRRRCGASESIPRSGVAIRFSYGLATWSLFFVLLVGAVPAGASKDYDSKKAGHPLRVAAYALHPLGVILDTLICRPAYWLGSHEPFKTLVGNTD
jgi:hypothetical protein